MHPTTDPSRAAPMRRIALLGVLFVAGILSCGKDVTGPLGSAARYVRDFAWSPIFPPAFQLAGGASSGVVAIDSVHLVLHHDDGSVALDTTIGFPAGTDQITLSLTVKLLDNAPAAGEPMSIDLGYLDGAGNVVFKGGPVSVVVAPPPAGSTTNPPVQVPVTYTGPGSNATAVVISTHAVTTFAGSAFQFTAVAKDINGVAIPGTPIVWSSLDPSLATITSPAAGNGVAQNRRGKVLIVAQLLTGQADSALLTITLPASQIIAQSGNAQTGTVGTPLALPLIVKVTASDGAPILGTTVNFAVATGGGSVTNTSAVSDTNGLAQTTWKLGTSTGTQSVTASSGTLTNSPLTFTATAQAATATKLVNTTAPANGVAGVALAPVVFTAEDNNGNVATTFTGPVSVSFGSTLAGATLTGTTTVNAVAGVATFSTLAINKNGTGYTLVGSSSGLPNDTTAAFAVAVGAPSKLAFTVPPSAAIANTAITPAIVVTAEDSQGNATPLFTGAVTLTFANNPTGATLGGTATVNAVGGVATFSGVSVSFAGTGYTLSAGATGLTSATSAAFNIGGGVATNLVLSSGGAQTGAINTALGSPVSVMVTDAGSNPVAGKTVNFAVLTGGGSVLPTSGVSNASGIVQTNWTLGALVGVQSISATSAGLTGSPLTITATGTVASAFSKTWTGATNNQWATATNWSPAGVPAATDSVLIPVTANNPQLAATATINGITINAGATLTLTSGAVTLNDNGGLDATGGILGTGAVVVNGLVPRNIKGTMTATTLTLFGSYAQNGTLAVVGNLLINSGGALSMSGNTTTVTGSFSIAGTGTLTMNNAADALTVAGTVNFGGASETGLLTNGVISVGGNFFQTNTASSFNASGTHQVVFAGAAAQTINFANPGPSAFYKLSSGNSIGVTLATNVVTSSDVTTAGPITGTFGLTIGGQLIDPLGDVAVGAISFTGGPNPVSASTPTINTNVTFNGSSALLANLTVNGGVNVNSASGSLSANGHTLTINGSLATANSGAIAMSNAGDLIVVNGSVTFAGTSGPLTNGVLQITGNFTQTTSATAFVASSPHITRFTGATPTISFANPTTSNFGTLQLETSGAVTFATNAATSFDIWLKTGTTPSVTGAVTVTAGRAIYDSTGGRWQVQNTVLTGSATLPRSMTTNLTFSASGILVDSLKLTGNALINASAQLDMNGHYMKVSGTFGTSANGTLKMTHVNDSLVVKGNASFNGGSTAGQLTNGYFEFDGSSFVQGVNTSAFAADAPHITWFWGLNAQTIAFANPGLAASHFGNLYLQDTATVLTSNVFLNGQFQTGGQASFHVEAAADQLITSNGSNLRNIVFDNVRWKLQGTNGNGLFPSLDNVTFKNISATTLPQFDYEYSVTTNLSLPGFTFQTVPTGGGVYINVVGPDTLTMSSISPATSGGFVSVSGSGAVNGWSNTATWTGGAATGAWNTAGNWDIASVPTSAMDIVINSGLYQPSTGGAVTVHNLTLNGGATLTVSGANMTVNGDINVAPGAQIALPVSNVGVLAFGNVTTDTAGTTGVTGCTGATAPFLNLQAGTHNITGKFCNLSNFGTYTATGPIQVVGSGSYGSLNVGTGSSLKFNGHRVDVYGYSASGTGTITMQNSTDSLLIHGGAALFQGGSETGLMSAGTVVDRSANFIINGTGYDASGGTQTVVVDTAFFQTLTQNTAATPGHGFNNVTMKGTSSKGFSGDQWITGTLLFDVSMAGPGNVSGSYNIHVNTLVDNSVGISGGAFQGSTSLHMTGTTPFNRDTLVVNNLHFDGGGTFALAHSLVTNYVVVDSNSTLSLNGHTLKTNGNSFTTQNGGTLTMTNANDTLNVAGGTAYFNGGASTLTAGDIEFQGLFQGYSGVGSPVAGANAASFSPTAGLTAHLNSGCCGNIAFLNPGTGAALSHFWMLQLSTSSTNTLYTDVFVDSLLLGEYSGSNAKSDSSAQGIVRTVTTKGVYNSGTFGMSLAGVAIVLNDGAAASTFFNSVTWTGSYGTKSLFTQNRTSAGPSIGFNNFSSASISTGKWINNIGTASLTIGASNTGLTGTGACSATGALAGGSTCP